MTNATVILEGLSPDRIHLIDFNSSCADPETLVRQIKQVRSAKALDYKKRRRASGNQRRDSSDKQTNLQGYPGTKPQNNVKTSPRPVRRALGKYK